MYRPSRIRRITRWTGVSLCVAILAMWAVSLRFFAAPVSGNGTPLKGDSGFVTCEHVLYFYTVPADVPSTLPTGQELLKRHHNRYPTRLPKRRYVPPSPKRPDFDARIWRSLGFGWQDFTQPHGPRIRRVFIVAIPYWLLLIAVAIPTAPLYYRGRRRFALTHCRKCNYALAGNISGRCPECGTVVPTYRPTIQAQQGVGDAYL